MATFDRVLHDCESAVGWGTHFGTIVTDVDNQVGTYALKYTAAASDSYATWTQDYDLTDATKVKVWMKSTSGTPAGQFYLFSPAGTANWDFVWPSSWTLMEFDLTAPDGGSTDLSQITSFRFDVDASGHNGFFDQIIAEFPLLNYIQNADFEAWDDTTDPTYWEKYSVNGGLSLQDADSHGGSWAVNIRSSGPAPTSSVGGLTSRIFTLKNSTIKWWRKDQSSSVAFTISVLDDENNILDTYSPASSVGSYTQQQWDISAYAHQNIRIRIEQHTTSFGAGYYTYIDDITLEGIASTLQTIQSDTDIYNTTHWINSDALIMPNPRLEDLTTFTEVDPNNRYSQTPVRNTFVDADTGYVYKDYGPDAFGDYEHDFEFRVTGLTMADSNLLCKLWAVTNDPSGLTNGQTLGVQWWGYGGYRTYLAEDIVLGGGTNNGLGLDTTYYVKVTRVGSVFTAKVYPTELDRYNDTNVISTDVSACETTPYRYLLVAKGAGGSPDGYVENFNINYIPSAFITSDANIVNRYQDNILSDAKIVHRENKTLLSSAQIQGTYPETLDSDALIRHIIAEILLSDAKIIIKQQDNITSDAYINSTIHEILSDSVISQEYEEFITSDAKIIYKNQANIDVDATVKRVAEQKNIASNGNIRKRILQTIDSNTVIQAHVDFYARVRAENTDEVDFNTQLKVFYAVPSSITNLTATDPGTGESIALDWDDDTNYGYNVYKDVGAVWVLQNEVIITDSDYVVGSLTDGVTYTFEVRGVNAAGTESVGVAISGIAAPSDTTPNYDITHYKKPDFEINISGVPQTDAILETVELIYGPDFSTAKFFIPKRPDLPGLPEALSQTVTIYINGRLVLTGYLNKRENSINSDDYRATYTVVSTLWNLTKYTAGFHAARPSSIPRDSWDPDSVACMSQLDYMMYKISYMGNYKIYTSPSGSTSYYRIGAPVSKRNYEVGKHIINMNTTKDINEQLKTMTIYGSELSITKTIRYSGPFPEIVEVYRGRRTAMGTKAHVFRGLDGSWSMKFRIYANNISDVKAFALINEPARASSFVSGLEVLPSDCKLGGFAGGFDLPNFSLDGSDTDDKGFLKYWPYGGTESRVPVRSVVSYPRQWKNVSASINYIKRYTGEVYGADITITPCPVAWQYSLESYTAYYKKLDENDKVIEETPLAIKLMGIPFQFIPDIEIAYTYKGQRLSATASSGAGASRCSMEGIDAYTSDIPSYLPYSITPKSNVSSVMSYLVSKASALRSKLGISEYNGTMTVLGDETLDLRTQVNGMEVSKITHEFTSSDGYLTHIDLTKERWYRGEVVYYERKAKEVDTKAAANQSFSRILYYDQDKIEHIVGYSKSEEKPDDPKGSKATYQ